MNAEQERVQGFGRLENGLRQLQHDPAWKDNLLFNECFHGDNAAGLGASHQTGWTGVVADLIRRRRGTVPSLRDLRETQAAQPAPDPTLAAPGSSQEDK